MFVFLSHLTVPEADHAGLERHFHDRSRLVDDFPGFLYLQLLKPQAGTATHTFLTSWTDADAFRLDRKDELAGAITDAVYGGDPTLMARFGEAGRMKCLQDMRYSLEHLAPAVALDDPPLFARYVIWLEGLLAARGVGSDDVRRSLEATRIALIERLPPDERAQVLPSLEAGLAALSGSAPT